MGKITILDHFTSNLFQYCKRSKIMILDHMFSDLPHLCFAGPGISLLLYAADDRRCQFHLRFNPQNSVAYTIPHVRPTEHRVDTDRQVAVGVAVATHYYVIPAPDFAHVAVAARLPPTRRRGSCHSATDKCISLLGSCTHRF